LCYNFRIKTLRLRYAASLAGVEQNTLDMALQRFTRRVGEAARGTGEAKEALASMGVALRDQNGHIRRSEDLLDDVAEALRAVEDPAERLRLAFKLFDSEGVAMVNMLNRGADGLADMRQRARDLGIVLEEDLIRNAEQAKDELDTLGTVISANLTRAILDLSPLIADLSSGLAELAADAGVAYERLKLVLRGDFNFEGMSLRSTRRIVAEQREELQEVARALNAIGDVSFLDDPIAWGRRQALERRLQERVAQYRQWAAKLAWMQAEAERNTPPPTVPDRATTPDAIEDDVASAQERARRIARIEQDLQRQLFEARHAGAERIHAAFHRLVAQMQTLIAPGGSNLDRVEQIMLNAAALRDARLTALARREAAAAARQRQANQRVIAGLRAESAERTMTDRERFVSQALRRLWRRRSVLIRKLWRNHLFSIKTASNFRIKKTCAHDRGGCNKYRAGADTRAGGDAVRRTPGDRGPEQSGRKSTRTARERRGANPQPADGPAGLCRRDPGAQCAARGGGHCPRDVYGCARRSL
jgi:hypothetical protein